DVAPAAVVAAQPAATPMAESSPHAAVQQSVTGTSTPTPTSRGAPTTQPAQARDNMAAAHGRTRANALPNMPKSNPTTAVNSYPDAAMVAAPGAVGSPVERPGDTVPPQVPAASVIALERTDEET